MILCRQQAKSNISKAYSIDRTIDIPTTMTNTLSCITSSSKETNSKLVEAPPEELAPLNCTPVPSLRESTRDSNKQHETRRTYSTITTRTRRPFMPSCTTDYQQPIIQRNPNKEIIQRDAAIGIIQRNPYNEIIQKDPVRDEAASPRIPTNIATPVVQQVAGGTSGVLRLADNQHQQHSSIPTPYPSSVSSDAMETIFAHPADRDKDNPQQQILHLD